MELKFMTPTEVWEGYDPTSLPLENSIISSENTDNIVCTKQYFTAEETPQGRIRAYLEMYSDSRWHEAHSALLLLGPCNRKNNAELIKTLLDEGYAVGVLDYCGGAEEGEVATSYPPHLSFATYPKCRKYLNTVVDSARNTPWFVWSRLARRAIYAMEQYAVVDNSHIGLIGIGEGGHIAWQVAGMDNRVRALAVIGDTGYRWAKDKPKFTEGNMLSTDNDKAFSMGVGAETYAKFVQCPTILITTRLSRWSDVDRAGDIISLVKSQSKQLLISGGMESQITKFALNVLILWLRGSIKQQCTTPSPVAAFEKIGDKLYLRLNTEQDCVKTSVYVCYGEKLPNARHWDLFEDLQKVDTNTYTLGVPIYDPTELVVAYATVTYEDGNSVSTPVQGVIPSTLGLTAGNALRESSHIIYDGSMGLGSFSGLTKDAVLDEDALIVAKGPFDISGISTSKGGLFLCRSASELTALNRTATLHFDAYSPERCELCINMYTYPEMKKYSAYVDLKGGEFWQKLILKSSDFKADNGKTLPQFAACKILSISNAEGIIFNNFLWI